MKQTHSAVICGAGIAGVSAAYFLSKAGVRDILLVDERPPLSLTSDRSTECYRNWWPDAGMLALMNRSIDLMEALADESGNIFRLNRRGYLYLTGAQSRIPALIERARETARLGGGDLRIHTAGNSSYAPAPAEGFHGQPAGADLLLGHEIIQQYYPYLAGQTAAALHVRRAGWLSAQQLGIYMLEQARRAGVQLARARVSAVDTSGGCVKGVTLASGERVSAPVFVNAAGPYLGEVGRLLGPQLPVYTELHLKVVIKDSLSVVGRDAPLLIWDDPQRLPWTEQEKQALMAEAESRWLTEPFPPGAHTRPEGGKDSQNIILLWEYKTAVVEPVWPPPLDDLYPEVALRGLSTMLPGLRGYFEHMPRPQLDGGYYTRTTENRALIGPAGVQGAYVLGALSGYGIMSACGAGDLMAGHVLGAALPGYAQHFELSRYEDPLYLSRMAELDQSGQL
ncbi:MAG: NAD(P)/FAD-dependent oxidoreductase [Bacteroidota bacterium]